MKQIFAVAAFIFNCDGKIFLAKFSEKFNQKWSIAGGKIDFGETPLEAVKREIKEETNIILQNEDTHYLKTGQFIHNGHHIVYVDYIGTCHDESQIKINEEFSEFGFLLLKRPKNLI